ncbi:MAG: flagellin [Eubacteriales bacterium]|nr:flagellin [Eubacteriales bacterium]
MRINHNIAALNTYRQLTANTSNTSKSLEKLSSGLRINRAGDDAAGLAISEKMRSQIRGLDTASRNANDGISLIQTAEGALNETHSILQRMKELAVQAANDTNTASDRAEMQKEINQLTKEIDRISTDTEFNTRKLLNGELGATATAAGTTNLTDVGVVGDVVSGTYTATISAQQAEGTEGIGLAYTAAVTLKEGSYTIEVTGTADDAAVLTLKDAGGNNVGTAATAQDIGGAITFQGMTIAADTLTRGENLSFDITKGGLAVAITDPDNKDATSSFSYTLEHTATAGDVAITVDANNAIKFHIGANRDQNMSLNINNMNASNLGVNVLDLTTQIDANKAIETIDTAINTVSAQRANLGAIQNRLEHTVNNLGTTSENLSASESRIRDVDMAKEMMEFTKNNILSQASQAMLAQANQQPQSVLQLLQ